jgi:hypothetical protein
MGVPISAGWIGDMRPSRQVPRPAAAAHEFVKLPLPFPETRSHIWLRPARNVGDPTAGRLKSINATCGNPMKMLFPCLRGGAAG